MDKNLVTNSLITERETCKLGDYLTIKHGWAFKGEYFSDDGNYILLTPGNFFLSGGFKYTPGKEKFYAGNFPAEYICSKGDLVIAMTQQAEGLLGSSAIVPENNKYLHNQRIGLVSCNDKLDTLYAYYLFNTYQVRRQIEFSSSGTKIKHTSPDRVYDVIVQIPKNIDYQKKVAEVLWNIDSKISLNRNINDNLYY